MSKIAVDVLAPAFTCAKDWSDEKIATAVCDEFGVEAPKVFRLADNVVGVDIVGSGTVHNRCFAFCFSFSRVVVLL